MPTQYTSLLGLALPVTGELQGTWGDTVNNSITSLLDTAVAGTTTLSTDGDVTLSTTTGASNQSRQAILLCTGARTAQRTIVAPAQSKIYTVINATTGGFSVKVVGAGPTTGVTITAGESALIAWNGSDFIKISNSGGAGTFTNLTVTGNLTVNSLTSTRIPYASTAGLLVDSANMTFNGTRLTVADLSDSSLTSGRVTYAGSGGNLQDSANLTFNGTTLSANTLNLTNALAIIYGGTNGTATPTAGAVAYGTGTAYAFTSAGTSNQVLVSNGTSAPTWANFSSLGVTSLSFGTTGLTPSTTTQGAITVAGTLATTNGGTGLTAFSANQVFYSSSTSAIGQSSNLTFDGTTLTAANFTDSSLTSGRVTFAGSGGNLTDSANLTWNGSTFGVTGTIAITGALTATADSTFSSTGALTISKGTTAQQPGSPVTGMLRYNTTTNQFEGYSGTSPAWNPVGGASLSNDTSTATNVFPLFANATTGSATTIFTSNAKLLYKPSTGEFQSSAVVASNGIFVNSQTVTANYTVPSGSNAMSSGPVTVADGITVTVSDGSVWTVI